MKLKNLDKWFIEYLKMNDIKDSSQNGLQVGDVDAEILKIAFAVDAGIEVFKQALEKNVQMLFVHHGIFWDNPVCLKGNMFDRVSFLIKNNLSLYAVHLPLDMHDEVGNNICIANKLGLKDTRSFGDYKGQKIGYKGIFEDSKTYDEVIDSLGCKKEEIKFLNFSDKPIKSVGIVSGGGAGEVYDAIDEEIDLFIIGDRSHSIYHICRESKINVIMAGHYFTETFGVKALKDKIKDELGLETMFVDCPSGM